MADDAQRDRSNDNGENDKADDRVANDQENGGYHPAKFDWVTARSDCSLPKVFQALRLEVEDDVKTRNGLRPMNSPYEFWMDDKGNDFTVLLKAKDLRKSVTFSLAEHSIRVRDDEGKQMFEVTLSFSDDGECWLHVDERDCELWQVRRMALEDLMFPRNR